MLKALFNNASRPYYMPEKPVILVSTLEDDKSRGDSHAYIGLGKMIAEKLGGDYHYVDEDFLTAKYPDIHGCYAALTRYIEETGTPDIMLARDYYPWAAEKILYADGKCPLHIGSINEYLSKEISGEKEHVAHHLTPKILKEEGVKFRAAYPEMPQQVVALIVADSSMGYNVPEMLLPSLKEDEKTGVFICTSRRTPTENYQFLMDAMSSNIGKKDAASRILLGGYDFATGRAQNAYNPYIGLLNEASHIVVIGTSKSIVTESLASGKTIYVHENYDPYGESEKAGIIKYFNTLAEGRALQTESVTPRNPTESVADGLIKKYRRHCQKQLGVTRRIAAYLMDG